MKKDTIKLAILGSTGSIGQQVLDIVKNFPDRFSVTGLAGGNNTGLLMSQIKQFQPKLVYSVQKFNIPGNTKLCSMEEMASHPEVDIVVVATSGKNGLTPTIEAIKTGKKVALSNKEVLVMAGAIVMADAKLHKASIIPIDSEHSALFQCLQGGPVKAAKLILTASGGPLFRNAPATLNSVTVDEALKHPTWKMGKKVTIDSATLMNKGLEVIEASWLFSMPFSKIEIVIHPQSVIHSLVEFVDGSLKAQLSVPDMRFAIQYALSYPERLANRNLPRLDLPKLNSLTFEKIDYSMFPCLQLALEAGRKGGTYPATLCAADEIAVELFLENRIDFTQIPEIIERTLSLHQSIDNPTLDEILEADNWARNTSLKILSKVNS
jgi:1-deoxy-D-xylulose-5-phosphate reductoisomerase